MIYYYPSHLSGSNMSYIDQEFLEPEYTRLEYESDYARIEQAKKTSLSKSQEILPTAWQRPIFKPRCTKWSVDTEKLKFSQLDKA